MTFAVNHMAYFVLTNGLPSGCWRGAGAHRQHRVGCPSRRHPRFDELQIWRGYHGSAYGQSKLGNILFTRELARRLAGTGVTANCLHPGFVATRFGEQAGVFRSMSRAFCPARLFALTPEKGAETIVYLASSPEIADHPRRLFLERAPVTTTTAAQDEPPRRGCGTKARKDREDRPLEEAHRRETEYTVVPLISARASCGIMTCSRDRRIDLEKRTRLDCRIACTRGPLKCEAGKP